jgi:hypothetical protein
MISLIIHAWPNSSLVATIIVALVIQAAGMPAGSFSVSKERRAVYKEIEDIPLRSKVHPIDTERELCGIGELTGKRIKKKIDLQLLKSPKYRLLKLRAYPAKNEGEDYYFKVNGVPVRIAWVERDSSGQYKAALIINETITGKERFEVSDLYIEGPRVIPPSPYIFGSLYLNILATDSGILEAYSCLRWRQSITDIDFQTDITWFSNDNNLVLLLTEHFRNMKRHMTVVWYEKLMPEDTHEALQNNTFIKHVRMEKEIQLEDILPTFILCNRHQYGKNYPFNAILGGVS